LKTKRNKTETKSWKDIKDTVYGEKGTEGRDGLERDFESFKIGLPLRNAGEEKNSPKNNWANWSTKNGPIFRLWRTMEVI